MGDTFPHLILQRETPVNDKRPGGSPRSKPPGDPIALGGNLQKYLASATIESDTDEGGFDDRRLFRFTVDEGFSPDDLSKIVSPDFRREIEVVSQEGKDIVVAFIGDGALESFEALLTTLADGDIPANQQVFFALQGIEGWRVRDRMGWALKRDGIPKKDTFVLDVELWPLEDSPSERKSMWASFEGWLQEEKIAKLDSVKQPGITLYRVRCNADQSEKLLHHRDIRTVDLPPRYGITMEMRRADIQDLGAVPQPAENAPGVTVLDSGLTTGHPLLSPAVGEAESFLPGKDPADEHGHGTLVGGIALYGDIQERLEKKTFVPELHLFSGRILDEKAENGTGFVANHITKAVQYFNEEYDCRVFNLSFGDLNKPYLGGHLRDLAFTLDTLSRDLDVLFVVSTGNVSGNTLDGLEWRDNYPQYFFKEDWSLVDPAPALNVLTVGSLARYDLTTNSGRYRSDPGEVVIAGINQPSPFSRCGPTVGGAIKPDLVAYGGNWAINTRAGNMLVPNSGLGELSTNWQSIKDSRLFADDSGTSFAAPHVAHKAAMLQREIPDASPNLMRALLVAHARTPKEVSALFNEERDQVCAVTGYGEVDSSGLSRSIENEVTLITETSIANKKHHFYEIPVPEDFLTKGKRKREISVALAYTPYVRSTRIDYRATRVSFKLVAASDISDVLTTFDQATDKEKYDEIKDIGKEIGVSNRDITSTLRNKGTVQSATWLFRQFNSRAILKNKKLFVVVTRHDFPWGESLSAAEEKYALVAAFRDRENEEAKLYTQIRTRLKARGRAKV